jgi:hypothetical protein
LTTAQFVAARRPLGEASHSLPVSGSLIAAYRLSAPTAALLVVTSVAGLLYGGDGLYQADPRLLPQFFGQDAFALVAALPALLVGIRLTERGSARGLVLWAGTLLYIAYWYQFYLSGIPFGPLFLVHVGLVSSSVLGLAVLLARVDVERFRRRFPASLPARFLAGVMIGLASLFALAWIIDVAARLQHGESLDPVARGVYVTDLTLLLPAMIGGGLLLWRRNAWGYVLAGPLLLNALGSMLTLATTSVLAHSAGVSVAASQLAGLAAAALVMLVCAAVYFRDLRV